MNTSRSDKVNPICTIGYSGRSREKFAELLRRYNIQVVVDVRRFPASKEPDFCKENLERWLKEEGISYLWLGETLGGYRKGGYKKYIESESFKSGLTEILRLARRYRLAIMCMERKVKYCHRRFIAGELRRRGVQVHDIE
ncbi:DUF488 domain-containing protein [Candidatus Bathyarchaeota archaeon]|nr:DUF488 domain-containing protein [Candidatus Bathyarchaeota archaeon]